MTEQTTPTIYLGVGERLGKRFRAGLGDILDDFRCDVTVTRCGAWIDAKLSRDGAVFVHVRERGYKRVLKILRRRASNAPTEGIQTKLT